jgi:hypothetical protein
VAIGGVCEAGGLRAHEDRAPPTVITEISPLRASAKDAGTRSAGAAPRLLLRLSAAESGGTCMPPPAEAAATAAAGEAGELCPLPKEGDAAADKSMDAPRREPAPPARDLVVAAPRGERERCEARGCSGLGGCEPAPALPPRARLARVAASACAGVTAASVATSAAGGGAAARSSETRRSGGANLGPGVADAAAAAPSSSASGRARASRSAASSSAKGDGSIRRGDALVASSSGERCRARGPPPCTSLAPRTEVAR